MRKSLGTVAVVSMLILMCFVLLCYPFFPGSHDGWGAMVSMYVQVLCLPMLLSVIPAGLWTFSAWKQKDANDDEAVIRAVKRYVWTAVFVCTLATVMLTLATRRILPGMLAIACLFMIARVFWTWKPVKLPEPVKGWRVPLVLALLPMAAICLQVFAGASLTQWSRQRAMDHARPLINGIELFRERYGHYPFTLNANWKDYHPGVTGTEKFHYSFDGASYTLYFEQPRFFYDRFGVREIVAYSPADNHLVVSHTGWYIDLGPDGVRKTPGWFASQPAGVSHWQIFWFD